MKSPSVKALEFVFGADAKKAKAIFKFSRRELEEHPANQEMVRLSHGKHDESYLILRALNHLGERDGCHGVEFMSTDNDQFAEYINVGDTYVDTVIYWQGQFRIQCLGDFVEMVERSRKGWGKFS